MHPIGTNFGKLVEAKVAEGAALIGISGPDTLPKDVRIVAIMRGRKVSLATGDMPIAAGDHVLIYVDHDRWPATEVLLG